MQDLNYQIFRLELTMVILSLGMMGTGFILEDGSYILVSLVFWMVAKLDSLVTKY